MMYPESVRVVMREVRAESDRYLETYRRMAPRGGEVAVGGEHFDAFLKGEALASLLRGFGRLKGDEFCVTALEAAKADAREMVAKWNARREYQVARWEGAADTVIESAYRRIVNAIAAAAEGVKNDEAA
jgi:hypothetical protein